MRIAVDAMGGDHGCGVVVHGVKLALQANSAIEELYLVGHQAEIEQSLAHHRVHERRIKILHASEVLTMEDKPLAAVRKKKDCSLLRAVELVKDGRADAVISPGNTGGLVAASTIRLRPLEGVDRPALATIIPTARSEFVLIDAGANPECKPLHLLQFGIMGSVYSREMLAHQTPRVGLLSNGTEPMKGNDLTREALKLFSQVDSLNFVGYVEGHDLFADQVDVVVTDGFIGNIVLKTIESMGRGISGLLRRELNANPLRQLGALLSRGAFRNMKYRMDPEAHGGAPLLGLNGSVFKIHGSARERMITNAVRQSSEAVSHHLTQRILEEVGHANRKIAQVGLGQAVSNPVPA